VQPRSPVLSWMGWPILCLLGACRAGNGLDGSWSGGADCGEGGTVGVSLELTEDEPTITLGTGLIEGLQYEGEDGRVELDLRMERAEEEGAQRVSVAADCEIVVGEERLGLDCASFDELGWDGEDQLGAVFSDFFSTGFECDFSVARSAK
jgi:hypothetical protein